MGGLREVGMPFETRMTCCGWHVTLLVNYLKQSMKYWLLFFSFFIFFERNSYCFCHKRHYYVRNSYSVLQKCVLEFFMKKISKRAGP